MEAVKQKPKKLSLKSLKRKLSWAKYPSLSSSHLSKNYNNNNKNHFHNGHPHYLNNTLCFCENILHSSASSSAIVNFTLDQDLNNLNIHEASSRGKSILKNSKTFNRIASLQEKQPCACTNNNYNKVFNSNNIGCNNCHNQAPFMSVSMTSSILMDSYGLVPNINSNNHTNNNNQKLHQNTNGKYQNQLTVDNGHFHQKNSTPNKQIYINNHSKPYVIDKHYNCSHCSINSSQQSSSNYLHQQNYTLFPSYNNNNNNRSNDNNTNQSNNVYHNGNSQKVTNTVDTRLFPATPIKLRNKTCRSHLNDNHNYAIVDPKTKGIIHLAPSTDDSIKRYSLPANFNLPFSHLLKQNLSPLSDGQTNRRLHRESMYELGFGKMESYTKLEKLGEGTYATVFKGKSHLTGGMVALKEIRLEHEEGAPCTAIREVSLLRDLKHINIVTLHDIIHTPLSLTLVFEYLDKDLKQYMDDCNNLLNMNNVKLFLFQVLRGLTYCHKRRILHRDLKPQNLLINHSGEVKLADFGLARAKSIPTKTYSNEVVTLWYRPPEILLGSTEYSTPIDMWGVGCILFEMSSGRPLSSGSSIEDQLNLIFKVLGYPTEYSWPGISSNTSFQSLHCPHYRANSLVSLVPRLEIEGHKLLKQLLNYDVTKRISSSEALHHDYFKSLGADVFKLSDGDSIYKLPYITLQREPGNISVASNAAKKTKSGVKQWRQSVVF